MNDVSLRALVPAEIKKGFGFFQSKPSTVSPPVADTPDELGDAWDGARLHLPLTVQVNGAVLGTPHAGTDMVFDFPRLVSHAAKSRALGAGTVVGSGTVSNADRSVGSACLAERRALETVRDGRARHTVPTLSATECESKCSMQADNRSSARSTSAWSSMSRAGILTFTD